MSSFNIKNPNNRFDLIASRIKYGTDGGINVDSGALYVNGANGRVGVGTTSPQTTLDVSGNIRTSGSMSSTGPMDISGYYQVNGVPINNSFYPRLNPSSYAPNAISSWDVSGGLTVSARKIVWSPELGIFAVVSSNLESTMIRTSPNGLAWTTRTATAPVVWGGWDMVWAPFVNARSSGLFVTCSEFGFADSSNGIVWQNSGVLPSNTWRGITWSQDKQLFVAVARGSTTNSVVYSSDAVTWTSVNAPLACNQVCYSPQLGIFVAIGNAGVMTSTNGINWTVTSTLTSNLPFIIWSPELGLFVATNFTGNLIKVSSDARTWRDVTTPLDGQVVSAISWSPELGIFFAVSTTTSTCAYSSNGINWTTGTIPNSAISLTWSPELGVFVTARQNTVTSSYRSSLAGRPPTSFNVFDSSFNNINELGLWTFQSFGRGVPVTKTANFAVQPGENWIICNGSGAIAVTLPAASSWPGEEIMIKTVAAQAVNSATLNVVPLSGGAAGTAILTANAGRWATLVSDGTNWVIMNGVI